MPAGHVPIYLFVRQMLKYLLAIIGVCSPVMIFIGYGNKFYRLETLHFVLLSILGIVGYISVMTISLGCNFDNVLRTKSELSNFRNTLWNLGLLIWLGFLLSLFLLCGLAYHGIDVD